MLRSALSARLPQLDLSASERGLALVGMLTAAVIVSALVASALLSAVAAGAAAPGGIELAPFRWDPRSGAGV
jgi:hypothetical protein